MNVKSAEYVSDILQVQQQVYEYFLLESEETIQTILDYKMSYVLYDDCIPIGYILIHPWPSVEEPPEFNVKISPDIDSQAIFIHDLCILENYRGNNLSSKLLTVINTKVFISLVSVRNTVPFWKSKGFQIAKIQPPALLTTYPDQSATLMYKIDI